MVRVVRLQADDWPRLRALRLRALAEAPDAFSATFEEAAARTPENWAKQLDDLPTFVAVDDALDVGMVRCAPDATPGTAWLISMWVAPDVRQHGIGGALVDAVTGWARANRVVRLLLDVADHNAAAVALYARKGFEPTGEAGTMP